MRKKLIAAIIAVLILIAAAVGVIVFMESKPAEQPGETSSSDVPATVTEPAETEPAVETTEETVGLTFPTENPDDVTPEDTFAEEDVVPPVTGDPTIGETEGPDANEGPEDEF